MGEPVETLRTCSGGTILRGEPAAVMDCVERRDYPDEVDFPRAWFAAPRCVGELDMPDPRAVVAHESGDVFTHPCHVVNVELQA